MSLRLTITSPYGGSFSIAVDDPEVRVGRASHCRVRLPYPVVSAHHLTIRGSRGEWVLVDAGSTNGTAVDGRKIRVGEEVIVSDGMRVDIVDVAIEFKLVVDYLDGGFTLAESGTLLRKMVGEAAAGDDEELAFLEVLEGPRLGTQTAIPDEVVDHSIGSAADSSFVVESLPARAFAIEHQDDGFRAVPSPSCALLIDEEQVEGPTRIRSGCHIRAAGVLFVFIDPLEAFLAELDEPADVASPDPPERTTDADREPPDNEKAPPAAQTGLSFFERMLLALGLVSIVGAVAALLIIFDVI